MNKGVSSKTRRAFTLIELLVVLLILGVLLAVAIPQYLSSLDKSKAAAANTNTRMLLEEIQALYVKGAGKSYALASAASNFAPGSPALTDLNGAIPLNPCTGGSVYGTDYLITHGSNAITGVTLQAAQGTCKAQCKAYPLGTG